MALRRQPVAVPIITARLVTALSTSRCGLAILLALLASSADAEQFNFDTVTLSTDLIAKVVNIEDDIVLTGQPQANVSAGSTAPNTNGESAEPTEIAQSESGSSIFSSVVKTEQKDETETAVAAVSIEESSSSIFSNVEEKPALQNIQVESSSDLEISGAETSITVQAEPESVEQEIIATITPPAIVEAPVTAAPEAIIDPTSEPSSSVFDEVVAVTQEQPLLVVDQPVSAGTSADMTTMPEETQGVIPLTQSEPETALKPAVETQPEVAVVATAQPTASEEPASQGATEKAVATLEPVDTTVETTIVSADSVTASTEQPLVESEPEPEQQVVAIEPTQTDTIAASSSLPEPDTAEQVVTAEQEASINEDEIIIAWATAWSTNNADDYLAFYAENFKPADKNLDRSSWEQLRRKRLKNKKIRIIVSNAEVYRVDGDITEVRFTQRYTSAGYKDRVIKSIEMTQTDKGWQFLSEKTIKELPFE